MFTDLFTKRELALAACTAAGTMVEALTSWQYILEELRVRAMNEGHDIAHHRGNIETARNSYYGMLACHCSVQDAADIARRAVHLIGAATDGN